jgi:Protein of unknown function (DUF4235)
VDVDQDKVWNAVATGAAVSAVAASKPAIAQVWRMAFGSEPPGNPAHPDVSWREAILWAVLAGALIGLVRLLAQRGAAGVWHRVTGHYPEALANTRA